MKKRKAQIAGVMTGELIITRKKLDVFVKKSRGDISEKEYEEAIKLLTAEEELMEKKRKLSHYM